MSVAQSLLDDLWDFSDPARSEARHPRISSFSGAATRWGTPQQVEWADEALTEARAALSAD